MAENKTQKTNASVPSYLKAIEDEARRNDCMKLAEMMEKATGAKPYLWGTAIIGFGDYRYESPSGRSGDWFVCGFSNRKAEISIYLMSGLSIHEENLSKLGKHKLGKGCLYIKKLADIDLKVFEKMLKDNVKKVKQGLSLVSQSCLEIRFNSLKKVASILPECIINSGNLCEQSFRCV